MGKAYLAKLTRWGGLIVLVIALGLPAFSAQAGEMIFKGRNVQSKSESTWKQIGDDENRGVGAYESIGLTFHENDEVSTYVNKGTYDFNHGSDTHRGYVVRTRSDGSTTTSTYEGSAKYGKGLGTWEGTFVFISGTGKFAGIKGEGTYKGTRYSNKMSVTDFEAKVSLPD
jgi:hypothetical protein